MKLYNTLSRKIEEFQPLAPPVVTFYSCGPTVYDYTHIGHIRYFLMVDTLKRSLNYLGYKVNHVINITDVGHLTSDEDAGEDKMEKGAKKSGKTVWEVADYYTQFFLTTLTGLNIQLPNHLVKAADHIQEMIQFNIKLEQKGLTYSTDEALYFDSLKFPGYGKLSGQKLEDKLKGARQDVYLDPQKKRPTDFALWFKRVGRFKNHAMFWKSPWGACFPGWHIECSTMSMKYLGETIDIHAGGVDHIAIHHENEIAQSEGATGKPFVRYWVHGEFLNVDGKKMSKSLGNFYTIEDIKKQGINPLSLRLLFLQTHYRQQMNFTWESAKATDEAYHKLKDIVVEFKNQKSNQNSKLLNYKKQFSEFLSDDLQTPQAVSFMWEMLKSNLSPKEKLNLLYDFDQVFGLKLAEVTEQKIPEEIIKLAEERQIARKNKDFTKSDKIRKQINEKGYMIEDLSNNFKISKI